MKGLDNNGIRICGDDHMWVVYQKGLGEEYDFEWFWWGGC
jgi:hypothetical protein